MTLTEADAVNMMSSAKFGGGRKKRRRRGGVKEGRRGNNGRNGGNGGNGRSKMYGKVPGRNFRQTKGYAEQVLRASLKDPVRCLETLRYLVKIGTPDTNQVFQIVHDRVRWYLEEEKGRLAGLDSESYELNWDGKPVRRALNSGEYKAEYVNLMLRHGGMMRKYDSNGFRGEDFPGEFSWKTVDIDGKKRNTSGMEEVVD
jgi:hypothetical protein